MIPFHSQKKESNSGKSYITALSCHVVFSLFEFQLKSSSMLSYLSINYYMGILYIYFSEGKVSPVRPPPYILFPIISHPTRQNYITKCDRCFIFPSQVNSVFLQVCCTISFTCLYECGNFLSTLPFYLSTYAFCIHFTRIFDEHTNKRLRRVLW